MVRYIKSGMMNIVNVILVLPVKVYQKDFPLIKATTDGIFKGKTYNINF